MHLKSCQSLVHPAGVQASLQRSAVFVNQQGALVRTCSSNHGNMSSRLPLSIISTNTFRRSHADSGSRTTLQLLPPTSLCESSRTSLFRDDDALLDIWTVIKPGHVREKIAIFAADVRQANVASGLDQTVAVFPDHAPSPALSRAVKAKGNWEQTINAKRRRRSGGHQDAQQNRRSPPADAHKVPPQQPAGGRSLAETAEEKVSVGEMVAFLEQQVNQQQTGTKALLTIQKNSTIHVLSKPPESRDRSEVKGEEPVSVSNMVAKLESECLRRCSRGDLSRSNSLRRTVGRVLLAAVDQNSASPPALSSAPPTLHRKTLSCPETSVTAPVDPPPAKAPSESISKVEEPPPGLLFLSAPAAWLNPRAPDHVSEQKLSRPPRPPLLSRSQSERRAKPQQDGAVRLVRHVSASQDFLDKRQRLQRLLEPQSFLSVLPLHLLVQIFQLLPTQSLAALQCTCHYFKFVIETYSIRPADSLWVSDPRYRDDPCKQCKKRYGRGDVSLCRWHHKPYCQALPYGPGYWMCCHDVQRDAPGCNVGLHDNRWVPAFHSINVPIYRRSRKDN